MPRRTQIHSGVSLSLNAHTQAIHSQRGVSPARSMPTRKQSTARGVSLCLAQCPDARNQQPEGCLSRSLAINQPLPRSWLGEGRYERQTIARAVWSGQPLPVASARGSGSLFPAKKKKSFQRSLKRSLKRSRGRGWGDFGASATTSTLDRPQATQRRGSPSLSQLTHLFLPTLSRSLGLERLVVEDE